MEYKQTPIEAVELKFNDDDWRVEGYATVWNSVDKMGDTILPGAFTKSLAEGIPVAMRFEHLRWATVGKWDSLTQDEKGLRVVGHLTRGHSMSMDLQASMRHGTIRGLSQGFWVPDGGFTKNAHGGRDLSEINLVEVSFTADPAEPKATIEHFKSALADIHNIRDLEEFLRESGSFSKSMATALVGRARDVCRSESEQDTAAKMRELQEVADLKAIFDRLDLRKLLK